MDAITSDPGWQSGEYSTNLEVAGGLRRHAGIWSVVGSSTQFWKTKSWSAIDVPDVTFSTMAEFQINYMEASFCAMDPNALLTMGWKWQRGDVARHTDGDLAAALGRITAKTFVLPIDEDMFFPPRDCAYEQQMIPGSELRVLHSIGGHFGLSGFEPSYLAELDAHPVRAARHAGVSGRYGVQQGAGWPQRIPRGGRPPRLPHRLRGLAAQEVQKTLKREA